MKKPTYSTETAKAIMDAYAVLAELVTARYNEWHTAMDEADDAQREAYERYYAVENDLSVPLDEAEAVYDEAKRLDDIYDELRDVDDAYERVVDAMKEMKVWLDEMETTEYFGEWEGR